MRKSWLLCVLLGTLSWGQGAPGTPPPVPPAQRPPVMANPPASAGQADAAAALPPNTPVITVKGVCPAQPKTTAAAKTPAGAKTPAADCKTVITKADFEKLVKSIDPKGANPQLKRNLAGALPRFIAMSDAAKKKGLDQTPQFAQMMKLAKMQILTNLMQQKVQEDAANVSEEKIADYYKKNPEAFEQYSLDRLFVPRAKQVQAEAKEKVEEKDEKLTEDQQKAKQAEAKAKQDENEQAMTKLAESLRTRAAGGEDFANLQKEAFEAAGLKIESPTVNMSNIRRTGLPPAQASVFDLKPGEVSQVINDAGGHYIYKMKSKDEMPLDQAKDDIRRTLQTQQTRDMMEKVNSSFQVETNEAYFGPSGPGMPPQRGPGGIGNPRMAPPPQAAPPAPAQAPPPAQPPAPPAAKPN
ncbi:MAG: peptidylprolyl isomerase [Candidatus Sulfotelmatobacter sp.]